MMRRTTKSAPVRVLPEEVANKIAAGEVVERPSSVVKELLENALDAGSTRVVVRLVAAGRRTIEIVDNGQGMSEQDALLAIERHATSKIRVSDDLDTILTYGFRGEALASIASVSRFELVTRRAKDEYATRLRVEGGILRDVERVAAPPGTRVTVNRLYFNTPVRAKFLKGIATELSYCIDCVQRFALAAVDCSFQLFHNEKNLLDIPEYSDLRTRTALIWGLSFSRELIDLDIQQGGIRFHGLIGSPALTRSSRSHQFFYINDRPIVNRSLQYGFEEGYNRLLTVGRRPVGIVLLDIPPRAVDVNIHPAKREARFRDEQAVRQAIRSVVRTCLEQTMPAPPPVREDEDSTVDASLEEIIDVRPQETHHINEPASEEIQTVSPGDVVKSSGSVDMHTGWADQQANVITDPHPQTEMFRTTQPKQATAPDKNIQPDAVYRSLDPGTHAPLQLFDTYLLIPEQERLLIIDQHALHERLTFDALETELQDREYEAQQLMVPLLVDVPPSYADILQKNLDLFTRMGILMEPFGGNTYQVTALCHLYDENKVSDMVYRVLEQLAQGDLFEPESMLDDLLRLAVKACRGSIRAGDALSETERHALLEGFHRLRPPYTCPHGRPIVTELTQAQMERSFRRRA